MADSTTAVVKFVSKGMSLKDDPAHMEQGKFPFLFNMQSMQEGSLCSRSGRRVLGSFSPTGASEYDAHTIRKFYTGGPDSAVPRYIGWEDRIYRVIGPYAGAYTEVASGVEPVVPVNYLGQRWNLSTYSAGATGSYWAYFATPNKMLKDNGTSVPSSLFANLQNWGIAPAFGVCGAFVAAGVSGPGPDNTVSGATAYDYIISYINPTTGNQGNPCQFMSGPSNGTPTSQLQVPSGLVIFGPFTCPAYPVAAGACAGKPICVAFYGTNDPQIPVGMNGTVAIYRRGGIYADGLFRLVGYGVNPGLNNTNGFIDNRTDLDIVNNPVADFQNDPPVPSSLPTPLNTSIVAGNANPGPSTFALASVPQNVTMTPGTLVYFNGYGNSQPSTLPDSGNSEQCIIETVSVSGGSVSITVVCQFIHQAGETVFIDTICNQPCGLTCQGFDSVFVAGDPNNPHVLYKSKTANPEQFPPVDETGIGLTLNVGSPSNPIQNILNFQDTIICLNLDNIYEVPLESGQMLGAYVTPAQRGLFQRDCYCVGDNAIYYLAYDGIYAWTGGQSVKCSDQLDPIFNHRSVSLPYFDYASNANTVTVYPVDMRNIDNPGNTTFFSMAYYHNSVYFSYRDTNGTFVVLRYEPLYNRWEAEYEGPNSFFNFLYLEQDTGNLIALVGHQGATAVNVSMMDEDGALSILGSTTHPTTDDFPNPTGLGGNQIIYNFSTPWVDLGSPQLKKLFTRIQLEIDNTDYTTSTLPANNQAIQVSLSYDYGGTDTVDRFTIPANPIGTVAINGNPQTGRRLVDLPLQQGTLYAGSTVGKQARAIAMQIACNGTSNRNWFYSMVLTYTPLAEIQAGQNMDYTDLGHQADKRIYVLTVTYDTGGQNVTLNLDTRTGINAGTENIGVQKWTLNSNGKTVQDLAVNDGTIVKELRLRTDVTAPNQFLEYSWTCPVMEKYPPDTEYFGPYQTDGNDYLKYVQQVDFEVDTGGQPIPVQIVTDTGTVLDTVTVQTTGADRHRTLAIGTGAPTIPGRQWRFLINPALIPAGGKFQKFSEKWVFQQADKGPVTHSYDWDDLGWPYDKRLSECSIEFDTTTGGPLTLKMDTLTGIQGQTLNSDVQTFVLGGNGRALTTFPINLDTIVKMVRIYPANQPLPGIRAWKYRFKKIDYPPDIIASTDWTLFSWPCQKIGRNIVLDMDTGGVPCVVQPEVDGVLQAAYTVTTTSVDRQRIIAMVPNIIGCLWRLIFTPGAGGKNQVFDLEHWLDFVKEPCAVTYVDSYEQNFGYNFFKFIKLVCLRYASPNPIVFTILTDGGNSFYTVTLPAQATRAEQKFYLPAYVGSVLNKSIMYRFQVTTTAPGVKLYADSRIEWVAIGSDQHGSFQPFAATPEMQQPVSPLVM